MVDIRGFNGGLNTDVSPELLPSGDYTYAMNVTNITNEIINLPGNSLIPNLPASVGNSTEWICGSFFDKKRQRIIVFTNNEMGYHRILSYNISLEAYTLLYSESPSPSTGVSALNWDIYPQFNPNGLIKDIKVVHRENEGDLYYFVGPDKVLYKFNFDTLLDWTTNNIPIKLDYFKVIKAPPKDLIQADIIDDTNYKVNNLYKKLFQFKYRFVYDDNEKSVWSALSVIPLPAKSTDPLYNALSNVQNVINLKFSTGDINVAKIEIAGRVNIESEWSDFFLIDTIDKERDGVADNIIFDYTFRNDSVYVAIDIQESNLLFDYVPDEVNALELANGNTLVIGGLKDGYDRDLQLDVTITNTPNTNSPAIVSTLEGVTRNASNNGAFTPTQFNASKNIYLEYVSGIVLFSGTPQVGDVITVTLSGKNRRREYNWIGNQELKDAVFNESWSVTFESGWSIVDLIDAFINHEKRASAFNITADFGLPFPLQNTPSSRPTNPFGRPLSGSIGNALYFGSFGFDMKEWWFDSVSVSIKRSFSFGQSDVFPTYKWNGVYKFGLAYYSKDGKTNGVFTNNNLNLQTSGYYADYIWTPSTADIVIPENETAQLFIGHTPPDWADYYHIVRTKELSCDFSLMVVSCDVRKTGGYVYIDIENIKTTNTNSKETSKVINYGTTTFVDGDRVRLLQKYNSSTGKVIWDTKEALDTPILAVEVNNSRLEIKVKDINTSSNPSIISLNTDDKFVIEIYRPAKVLSDDDLVYYEVGRKYDILTDANGDKYHDGTQVVTSATYWSFNITGLIVGGFFPIYYSTEFAAGANFNGIQINSNRNENDKVRQNIKAGDYIEIDGTLYNDGIYLVTNVISDSNLRTTIIVDINYNALSLETIQGFTIKRVSTPSATNKIAIVNMFNDGDYYFKTRTMVTTETGSTTGAFFVAEKNFSETYLSAVWSQGRPLIVDENIKEEYFPAMLRFSQSYIYGTNINNLNRFYPNNFEEADASFGDILRLKTRENFIRLFQRFKTGMIPIYRQIIIDNANSSQVALSERLLNKPNYYNGEYGIDKYGSSLVSTDYGDYFIDTDNKAIVRASLDGITNISDTNSLSFWANQNIKENTFGLGCFNYENRNVIMLIGHIEPIPNQVFYDLVRNIVAYAETDKTFESFYGYTDAETMLFINGFVYTGYNGALYIHNSPVRNNFYGVQQNSSITTVFNGGLQLKKTYTAIEELANGLWIGTISTGPLTNQTTSVSESDFQKTVGAYTINSKENKFNATIKRDQNSPGGKFQGAPMKGLYAQVALTNSLSSEQRLISVSLKYIQSPLTNS